MDHEQKGTPDGRAEPSKARSHPGGILVHFEGEQADGDACVKAHVNYYRKSGIDFIKIMSDGLGYPLRATRGWRRPAANTSISLTA